MHTYGGANENMRYTIRKEFFGGLVYDKNQDYTMMIDQDFLEFLSVAYREPTKIKDMDAETIDFLEDEGFMENGNLNYSIIDSGYTGETLSAPGRIHFYYTSACNLNCAHCFTKANRVTRELSFDEKMNLLNQMVELGVNEILIGGGEPFTQTDFPDFVEACLERGIITKVFTNGLLLNDELIDRMSNWDLKYLSISIDGSTEDEYKATRGVCGLKQIKEVVRKIKEKCSFTVAASVTVGTANYQNAEKLLALIDEFGFDRLKVRPVKPAGNVLINRETFPKCENYMYFIKNAQLIWNEKYKEKFTLDFSWGDTRLFYNEEIQAIDLVDIVYPYEGYGCFAGKMNIVFDSAGNAITCGFLPDSLTKTECDNLQSKTLKQIWDNGQAFEKLRNLKGNPVCEDCRYYPICRGGCMARNIFYGLDINSVDPWCMKKRFPLYIYR